MFSFQNANSDKSMANVSIKLKDKTVYVKPLDYYIRDMQTWEEQMDQWVDIILR